MNLFKKDKEIDFTKKWGPNMLEDLTLKPNSCTITLWFGPFVKMSFSYFIATMRSLVRICCYQDIPRCHATQDVPASKFGFSFITMSCFKAVS